jgi:MFS-type transporter involved in bile tolerance (Atg22 family)
VNRRVAIAALADIACIVVFVAIGRSNHKEGEAIDGILTVAAPFLIALVVGWVAARAWAKPMQVETAFIIWPITVAVGMVLRNLVFDRGTALPFIIVATLVTGVFLVGWRMVVARVASRSLRPSDSVARDQR